MISTPAPFGVWPPQGPALSQPPLESPDPAGPLISVISTLWTTFTVEGLPVTNSSPPPPAPRCGQDSPGLLRTNSSLPASACSPRLSLLPLKMPVWPGLSWPGGTAGDQNALGLIPGTGHRVFCIWSLEKQDAPPSEGCLSKVSASTTLSGHG